MNNSLKKIQAWRAGRRLRSLARWEQIRAKGKARFVFQGALAFGLTVVGATDVYDHVFGTAQHSISLFAFIWNLLIGIVIAFDSWNAMEGTYKNALIEARVNASPSGAPHNNPLQITADSQSE